MGDKSHFDVSLKPLETAYAIVHDRLSNDCTLEDCTNLTITELTEALDICLTSHISHTITYVTNIFLALPWVQVSFQ